MTFIVYKDIRGGYRWRLVSANGRIMADSAEAYVDANNVEDAITTIKVAVPDAKVVHAQN